MQEFSKILNHLRRLKANTKDMSSDELSEARDKLDQVIQERREEERKAEEELKAKRVEIERIRREMEAAGVDISDLAPELQEVVPNKKTGRKRAPLPAKYEYWVNGERHTWTGQGRMPKAMREAIEAGSKTKDDFLIK